MNFYPNKVFFKNVYAVVGGIFILIGLTLMLVGGVSMHNLSMFYQNSWKTEGTIEWVRDGRTGVLYEVDGETMEGELSFSANWMRRGDSIEILVDNQNPMRIRTPRSALISYIFIGIALILFVTGIVLLIYTVRRKKREKLLYETGRKLYATIVGIGVDRKISSNYRHPYILYCQYRESDGYVREFISGPIWERPDENLVGMEIPVYVDEGGHYLVDYDSSRKW